uniref:Uncharacterized protein n=1 Tax=Entomoneis paludosa TaxID=265537 RepID=A0A7S2YBC5_9STRA
MNHARSLSSSSSAVSSTGTVAVAEEEERPSKRSRLSGGGSDDSAQNSHSAMVENLGSSTTAAALPTSSTVAHAYVGNAVPAVASAASSGGKLQLPPTPDQLMSLEPSPRTERALKVFGPNEIPRSSTARSSSSGVPIANNPLTKSVPESNRNHLEGKDSEQRHAPNEPGNEAMHGDASSPTGSPSQNYQRQEYDEGMFVFTHALNVDPAQVPSESMRSASLLYNVGLTHVCRGKYPEARRWFELALVRISLLGANHSSSVALAMFYIYHNLGHVQYRLGRNEEAMKSYRKALALARDGKLGNLHSAACLNCIAVLLFHNDVNSDSRKVLNLFENALAVYRSHCNSNSSPHKWSSHQQQLERSARIATGTLLNNIGRVYYLDANYDKALEAYCGALEIRQALLGPNSIDVAATICNKGQTHHQRGQLDLAMDCYQEFLDLAPTRLGSNHRDIATIYKCMAEIHHEQGRLEEARTMYEQALQAGKSVLGNFHPELASTLNKLGNLYYEIQDLDTALKYYTEGLKVEQVVLEATHPHIVVTLMNIAQIHRNRGNFAAALEKYQEVHSLQMKSHGSNSLEVANTLSNIGLMQYQTKAYSEAFNFYQEALRIQRDHYGSDENLEVASTLNSIGLVLFNQGIYGLAKGCFNDSLRVRKRFLGADHRDVAILWYNIATIYLETGDDDQAIHLYKETLRVERSALGENHQDVILTLQHLGLVHQQRGELEHALNYFSQALDIERARVRNEDRGATGSASQIAVGKLLNLVGNIHLQQANVSKMMDCYAEASRIYRDWAQPNDTLVIAGYNFYGLTKLHPPSAPKA